MLRLQAIGNLGADAELHRQDGREFVTFKVADTRKWRDAAGQEHTETQWISCTMNGAQSALLPYLKKGTKVYVDGSPSTRVYSSTVDRAMKAGLNLAVFNLELVGGSSDEVPRRIALPDGQIIDVNKAYYIDPTIAKKIAPCDVFDQTGHGDYYLDKKGFVWLRQTQTQQSQEQKQTKPEEDGKPFI